LRRLFIVILHTYARIRRDITYYYKTSSNCNNVGEESGEVNCMRKWTHPTWCSECECRRAVCRCLSEVNQTASIVDFQHKDVGRYRCVAYGHNGDVISNEVKLKAEGQNS